MNNNYLKPGFHHSDPQLPPALGPAGSPGPHARFYSMTGTGIMETPWKLRPDGSSEIIHGVSVSYTASGLNDVTHQQEGGGVVNSY